MRTPCLIAVLALLAPFLSAQPQAKPPQFDIASVKPSRLSVGPDYNNQITFTLTGLSARNATLKRLIAEAWNLQINQILGPRWIDQNEYDIDAHAAAGTSKEQMAPMLRSLLTERFKLKEHAGEQEMHLYELVPAKTGPKIQPIADGKSVKTAPGFHFHGDMHRFADLLAVQFSIPATEDPSVPSKAGGPPTLVIDKTGLEGTFDFNVDIHPELNTDMFTVWRRALEDQLGLRIESTKGEVTVVVVDDAAKIPTEN
jgi:uncharacterized protein (TIGR03435 family)